MKLKTLKDLEWDLYDNDPILNESDVKIINKILKAEAVKWWKKNNCGDDMCCTCEEMWREFFNITEEDLK